MIERIARRDGDLKQSGAATSACSGDNTTAPADFVLPADIDAAAVARAVREKLGMAALIGKDDDALTPDQLPALIASVNEAISGSGKALPAHTGGFDARRAGSALSADKITCLDCGWAGQVLKRHLSTAHSMSVDEYRARWDVGADHPMVARDYAARRSQLARAIGFGKWRGRQRGKA